MNMLIVFVLGLAVGYWWGMRKGIEADPRRDKVLALFDGGKEVSNETVEAALGVSDATATRILDSLEKSGHIEQIGTTGAGVVYRRK
jgi:predicted HTH transcriptional regulator